MHNAAKPATKAEIRRFEKIAEIGCLACRIRNGQVIAAEIHHLIDGNKRMGHRFTIGLCNFHHRGVLPFGLSPKEARIDHGPSLIDGTRLFKSAFGADSELLIMQDALIQKAYGES